MEESKESKEAGYNKKHWWDGTPVTYEALEEKAEHWTLGADAATATLLQQISSKMIARTHEVEAALKNVCEDVDDLHVSLSNVATSLHLLSNMQFTENRTYQEDESSKLDSVTTNIKTEKSGVTTQEDLMSSCCQAIAEGLEIVKNSYMKMEISDSESEGTEEDQQKKGVLTIYKRLNPYENRKLPHLIGSSNFYTDDTLGLIDVDEEEEDRQIKDEKWSTTSSVCSGDGREGKDDRLSHSVPIVANSSKMEDEDSDSDGSFILSSKEVSKREVKNLEQHRNRDEISTSSDHINKKGKSTPSTLSQPSSNGVLLDSDEEYGPIFGPPRDSYITRPSPRHHIDSESLFRSDLKKPELSQADSEKEGLFRGSHDLHQERLFRGTHGPHQEVLFRGTHEPHRERSKLFDLSDSDEEGLFSSKKDRKPSGTAKQNYGKHQNFKTPEIETNGHVGEEAKEDSKEQGLKDDDITQQSLESNLAGRLKKPVGGINIFNAAITKAIENQHLSVSSKEHSVQNSHGQHLSNEEEIKRKSPSKEKEEEGGLFLPKSVASSHINNTSSKVNTVSSNNPKKKPLSSSLFFEDDDDEDLFRPVSKSFQSAVVSRSPVLPKSKSLDSNTSVSIKSKIDQRATTLDSIFGDSDDDLFTSVRKSHSNKNLSVVVLNYQTEPPPLPHSSNSSSLSDKKDTIPKNVKSKVSIFSSSSSDDEIFTPRKPRDKGKFVSNPEPGSSANVLRQEPLKPPPVDVKNSYSRSEDLVTNEHSINPTYDNPSNTYSDPSSKLSTKGKRTVSQNLPSTISKKSQIQSLFGSSDEDDDDNIFATKSKEIGEKKILSSSHSDKLSSSDFLKSDEPKKVIDDTSNRKSGMDENREIVFNNDSNTNTLSNKRNIGSDSSEDDIFKSSSKQNSNLKDSFSKSGKMPQLESSTPHFGSTVSDSVSTGQGASSQSYSNTQNKNNVNDIFNDSGDTDIFSEIKSKSSTVKDKKSDKPTTRIDSSDDDDLFSNKKTVVKVGTESNNVQNLSEKPGSNDLISSNSVKDEENLPKKTSSKEYAKNKGSDNNISGINNNDSTQKKNEPRKNIFSSDSDEDIFSTIKTNIHRKETKNLSLFSDSDDNDDIFSTNFKSKHKVGDSIDGIQTSKSLKTQVPKPDDTKDEVLDFKKKPGKMKKPVITDPVVNEKENSTVKEKEVTKSHFVEQSRVNFPINTSTENSHKGSLTKSIFDDEDDDDLFTPSTAVTEERALKSSVDKNREVDKDSTDGIASSKPKHTRPNLGKENNSNEVKSKPIIEKKKPVNERPLLQEKSVAEGASLFKGDSLSQSLSPTKNTGGLTFARDDEHSLSSPTKKPVGGVALFGGEELFSKIKSRRKSSSESENANDTEDISTEIKSSNFQSVGSSSMAITPSEVKASKISSNQKLSSTVTPVTQIPSSVSNHNPSISQEVSVSFESKNRASNLLVSVNKDRPKIQHQRKLPSRVRKNRKETVKNSHLNNSAVDVSADVDVFDASIQKEETMKKVPDLLSKIESSPNSGNGGEMPRMSNDKSPPQSEKRIGENNYRPIDKNNKLLDSKTSPAPAQGQENFCKKSENMQNSCTIFENKKSITKDEISSKQNYSSSYVDPSRKLEPPSLGLEPHEKKIVSSEPPEGTSKGKNNFDYSKEEQSLEKKNLSVDKVLTSQEKHSKKSSLNIFDDDDYDDLFSSTRSKSDMLHKNVDAKLNKNKVSVVEKHLNVDDIFNDGKIEKGISVSKLSKPSTNIFGDDDDDDIDSLFNASTNKKLNKTTESTKTEPKLTKEPAVHRKELKPSSSIFSDDDDDDSLFSSTTSSSKKVFAPPKVKTGKSTEKQLSIFNDDDDGSESDLFGGTSSASTSQEPPPKKIDPPHNKTNAKETQKSLPSKLSKERTFVDPLMGNLS